MFTRKQFIKSSLFLTLAAALFPKQAIGKAVKGRRSSKKLIIEKDDCILFYGDSITDGNRNREVTVPSKPTGMGAGYAMSVSSFLASRFPDMNLMFWNRGINGNKTFQMIERLDKDCLSLKYKPTVVSVLTGINDYALAYRKNGKGDPEAYERDLRELLTRIKTGLPGVKLIILEPYAIAGIREKIDAFLPDFYSYPPITRKVAEEEGAVFVPLQKHFDEAADKYGRKVFSTDGVHPWAGGIELIARAWLDAVEVRR